MSVPEGFTMSPRTLPPFRADHVGSFLRPARLHEARKQHAAGVISAEELRAVEDEAVREIVELQREVGLRSVTDGEFRRATWHMDFVYQIGGISKVPGNLLSTFHNPEGDIAFTPDAIHVTRRLSMDKTIFGEAFAFLQSAAGDLPAGDTSGTPLVPKLTIPAPSMVHYRSGVRSVVDESVYPDVEEFWTDLGAAYNDEMQRLAAQGCRYLQLDDTSLAYVNDPAQREYIAGRGEDAEHIHERYIALTNAAVAGRPSDMAITTHLCRGNFRSSWVASGGYDFVAESLFSQLDVDGFFLEYDDERSGGFEPLRFVPKGKQVVLGLVTTKRPQLESKDDLKRRIDEAAKYVPLDQLCLSGQCGFASTEQGNALTQDYQKAKLELIVETAAEVWG
ncbi:MAG: 5-methyltetrahydropteroyltriglutamate--homocysteine S-methyltransferase [Trebonia sp.]